MSENIATGLIFTPISCCRVLMNGGISPMKKKLLFCGYTHQAFFWAFFEGRQGHGCPRKHEFWGNFWPILTRKRSILWKIWLSFRNFAWVLGIMPKKAAKKVDLGKISWVLRKILSSFELEFSKNAQKKPANKGTFMS